MVVRKVEIKESGVRKFTLIELIIVVAIMGILVSILMPSLSKAKERAKFAVCLSNQKQVFTGLSVYSLNNKTTYPVCTSSQAYIRNVVLANWGTDDIRPEIAPYGVIRPWKCPNLDAPYIDDPRNTRSTLYSHYSYFPGATDSNLFNNPYSGSIIPLVPSKIDAPMKQAFLQDQSYYYTSKGAVFSNHGRAKAVEFFSGAINPSWNYKPVNSIVKTTVNIVFYDGHAKLHYGSGLVFVGNQAGADNYSVLPK